MARIAEIKPRGAVEFHVKQSKYRNRGGIAPELPTRALLVGPSGSGKSVLLQSLVLDVFRTPSGDSCFERIFVWSPSVDVDVGTWGPVREFMKTKLRQDPEASMFAEWNARSMGALREIIAVQTKLATKQKPDGDNPCFQCLCIFDDLADNPSAMRGAGSAMLTQMFMRGRHSFISCIVSVQRWRTITPLVRSQATDICIWRFRAQTELLAFVEELGVLDKREMLALYHEATEAPYSFLYVNTTAQNVRDMFFKKFSERLVVDHGEERKDDELHV
jgi:hypothetical protein